MKFIFAFIFSCIVGPAFAQAAFSMDVDSGCAPMCINFQDQATNATAWSWNFGDASTPSTFQSPAHCFINGGTYTVTLTETFASGTSSVSHTVFVFPNPIGAFSFAYNGNNTVTFTDQSTGAASWEWYFGDNTAISTLQNPVHTYASSSTYSVFLSVTSGHGCVDTISQVIMPTGINDYNKTIGWNIFPNPANGQITLQFNSPLLQPEIISVENVLGEIILREEISGTTTIDLEGNAAGIYFIRLGNGPAQKLVIEK